MGELNHQVRKHIRYARQWLERAENAFDGENPLRGELDLLLAQAEMKRAQEKRRPGQGLARKMVAFRAFRLTMAALTAGLLFIFLLTVPPLFRAAPPAVSPLPVPAADERTVTSAPAETPPPVFRTVTATVTTGTAHASSVKGEGIASPVTAAVLHNATAKPPVPATEDDVRRLVQIATKALKGDEAAKRPSTIMD